MVRPSMLPNYPPRVHMLRAELIKAIPKMPNTKATVTYTDTLGTHQMMLIIGRGRPPRRPHR